MHSTDIFTQYRLELHSTEGPFYRSSCCLNTSVLVHLSITDCVTASVCQQMHSIQSLKGASQIGSFGFGQCYLVPQPQLSALSWMS